MSISLGRIGALLAVAVLGLTAAAAPPPNKALDEILSWAPHDSAVFIHVDVPTVWKSKQMEAARKANPEKIYDQLTDIANATGIAPESIQSFTLFLPQVKGNGDQARVCAAITLSKPYNPKQLVTALAALAALDKIPKDFATDKFKKERENVYSISSGRDGKEKTLFLFDHPNRIVILGPKGHDLMKPTAVKDGPIGEAIAAAREKTAVLSINFANLPDEIRMENLPAEAEPFKPLIHADAIIGTADLADELTVHVRVKTAGRAKALEAEKSMGVVKMLIQTVLGAGIGELKKDEANAKLVDLAATTQTAFRTAKIGSDDTQATATLRTKADFDVTPIFGLFTGAGQAAARSITQNNLKQLALAMHNYDSTYNTLPAAAIIGKKGKPLLSWRVSVLPYIEQSNLYQKFKLDEPWDSAHNKKVFDDHPMPPVFTIEGVTKKGEKNTHMQVFRGHGAMFDVVQGYKIASIADGTSNTFMIATGKTAVPWTKPDDIEYDPKGAPHDLLLFVDDTFAVAMGDGSVRTMRKSIKAANLHAFITRNGGEVARED